MKRNINDVARDFYEYLIVRTNVSKPRAFGTNVDDEEIIIYANYHDIPNLDLPSQYEGYFVIILAVEDCDPHTFL